MLVTTHPDISQHPILYSQISTIQVVFTGYLNALPDNQTYHEVLLGTCLRYLARILQKTCLDITCYTILPDIFPDRKIPKSSRDIRFRGCCVRLFPCYEIFGFYEEILMYHNYATLKTKHCVTLVTPAFVYH